MSQSALVLFSGGQDSTTCLAWALEKYEKVETIGFIYDQRHSVELDCRKIILKKIISNSKVWKKRLGQDYVIDLSVLSKITDTALTTDIEITMSENGYPNTFLPGRNLFFFITAAAIAYKKNILTLVGGMCETDFSGYPDCRKNTIKSLEKTINLGLDKKFILETPLMKLSKCKTWMLAKKIGGEKFVDLIINDTHTCYKGTRQHKYKWGYGCGGCPACTLRKNGYLKFCESSNK